ncbi:MAG: hypothetical protein ABIK37_00375 [candidate division WOR-3 bacterium]
MPADAEPRFRGYRLGIERAIRANSYLRVFFSALLLLYAGFGPCLLFRFPGGSGSAGMDAVTRFYAFRPVLFALVFAALVCVLAALARRAAELFAIALAEDTDETTRPAERERYIGHLFPSPLPFALAGQPAIDLPVLLVVLAAYSFWVIMLVDTIPAGLGGFRVAGIVLGSYGLFATVIAFAFVWFGLTERRRGLRRRVEPPKPQPASSKGIQHD